MTEQNIHVPLPEYIEEAARVAAWTVIREHTTTAHVPLETRVQVLETRFNILLGAIFGSGILGGAAGAGVWKLLSG